MCKRRRPSTTEIACNLIFDVRVALQKRVPATNFPQVAVQLRVDISPLRREAEGMGVGGLSGIRLAILGEVPRGGEHDA